MTEDLGDDVDRHAVFDRQCSERMPGAVWPTLSTDAGTEHWIYTSFDTPFVVMRARIGASPALVVRALRRKKVTQNRFLSIVQNSV